MIVEPVLTVVALDHKLIHVLMRVRFSAIAIRIEVVLIVEVSCIFIIEFFIKKLAGLRHTPIAAVTAEIKLGVELNNFVTLMAVKHASYAEAVRFNETDEISVAWKASLDLKSLFFWELPDLFLIAS